MSLNVIVNEWWKEFCDSLPILEWNYWKNKDVYNKSRYLGTILEKTQIIVYNNVITYESWPSKK